MIHFSDIASVYNQYMDQLYAYALHLGFDEDTAMDAIHDVFYKLCTHHNTLDKVSNLRFYLFRMLKNRLIDIYRANKDFSGAVSDEKSSYENISFQLSVTIEDELIQKEDVEEIRQKVETVLQNLTDRQREIIYLRYIQEYDYEEIAELMQISVASCRNLISKSLGKLKDASLSITSVLLLISSLPFPN